MTWYKILIELNVQVAQIKNCNIILIAVLYNTLVHYDCIVAINFRVV